MVVPSINLFLVSEAGSLDYDKTHLAAAPAKVRVEVYPTLDLVQKEKTTVNMNTIVNLLFKNSQNAG